LFIFTEKSRGPNGGPEVGAEGGPEWSPGFVYTRQEEKIAN